MHYPRRAQILAILIKPLGCFLLVSSFFQSCNKQKTNLKFDLSQQIGDSVVYSFVHSHRWQIQSRESADTTLIDIKLKVISYNGKQNRMDLTFLNLAHRRANSGITSKNSNFDYKSIYDSIIANTIGKTLEVYVNEKGEVDTVRGYPEMVASIASALSADKRSVYQELNDYASDAAVQDILNRLFAFFPNEAVKVGDNWGNTITMVAKAPINFNSLFTLEKIAGDSLYVNFDSKILGGTSNYHLTGMESGTVVLNKNTHLPYLYTSNASSTTNTNYYDVHDWEQWVITLRSYQRK